MIITDLPSDDLPNQEKNKYSLFIKRRLGSEKGPIKVMSKLKVAVCDEVNFLKLCNFPSAQGGRKPCT